MRSSALKKHAELMSTTVNGRNTFRLLTQDQMMCEFFDGWAYRLAAKNSYRTVKTYCYAVLQFINYITEVAEQHNGLTPTLLTTALDSYESFLVFGEKSDSPVAANVAKVIGLKKPLGSSSITTHFAAINRFIEDSENLRVALLEMQSAGYISNTDVSMLAITTSKYIKTPSKVMSAIRSKSWLAGCISGGYKKIKQAGLSPTIVRSTIIHTDEFGGDEKTFPIDKCQALIESATCLRDKVLWCLIAASGIRYSEAVTVLIDDVIHHKVLIVDPKTRVDEFRKHTSESILKKLTHKGRTHPDTFLIEPFISMFWRYLELYLAEEQKKENDRGNLITHRFLFRNLKDSRPLLDSYQSLLERFVKASLEITGQKYGFHSLRHMYAYYLANHCPSPNPRPDKPFGLPLEQVQKFMGHASIQSTARYGRTDIKLLEATLCVINMLRMENPFFSVANQRIKYLENEVERLKQEQQAKNTLGNENEVSQYD